MNEADPRIFCVNIIAQRGNEILLIRKKNPPAAGELALPGGLVRAGESIETACARVLHEETGLRISVDKPVMTGIYSEPDRDPRGPIVSVAFYAKIASRARGVAGGDTAEMHWVHAFKGDDLALDHAKMVNDAITRIFHSRKRAAPFRDLSDKSQRVGRAGRRSEAA